MKKARTTNSGRFTVIAAGALLAASGVAVGGPPPAHAAPPGNDSIVDARAIAGVPTRIVQNTRGATSSRDDGECVAGASVWYRFRPTATSTARVVTIGSRFDTVLAVFRGPRASRTLLKCNDDALGLDSAVQVRFREGVRYWIAVSACCRRSATGGRSVLTLYHPRPAAATATLASVETGTVSGRIFASGAVRCATPSEARVRVTVSQRLGDFVARGSGAADVGLCGPRVRPWAVAVDSETGIAFQEGVASVTVRARTFDGFDSAVSEQTANVTVGSSPNRVAHRPASR